MRVGGPSHGCAGGEIRCMFDPACELVFIDDYPTNTAMVRPSMAAPPAAFEVIALNERGRTKQC